MPTICNGYCISSNLAGRKQTGRKYEVSDTDGKVLFTTTESIGKANEYAESKPAGDVQPESVEEPLEEATAEEPESEE